MSHTADYVKFLIPPFSFAAGPPVTLLSDASSCAIFMATADGLYEVCLHSESHNMWRVYLEFGDSEAALRLCSGPAQRDVVHRFLAEKAYGEAKYEQVRQLPVSFGLVT